MQADAALRSMSAPQKEAKQGRSQGFWAGLYFASVAIVAALKVSGAIDGTTGFILMVVAMVLLIPMIRAGKRNGCESAAMQRYNKRVIVSAFGYVLGLGIAITLWREYELSRPLVFAVSMLPTLPTFGVIWAMGRYFAEEQDEYLRHQTTIRALGGLGLVLALGIFWGFLEMFELVPHVWAWWVLPAWALGMGAVQIWQKARGA